MIVAPATPPVTGMSTVHEGWPAGSVPGRYRPARPPKTAAAAPRELGGFNGRRAAVPQVNVTVNTAVALLLSNRQPCWTSSPAWEVCGVGGVSRAGRTVTGRSAQPTMAHGSNNVPRCSVGGGLSAPRVITVPLDEPV